MSSLETDGRWAMKESSFGAVSEVQALLLLQPTKTKTKTKTKTLPDQRKTICVPFRQFAPHNTRFFCLFVRVLPSPSRVCVPNTLYSEGVFLKSKSSDER